MTAAFSGGTFSVDPTEWVADGYAATKVGERYEVWPAAEIPTAIAGLVYNGKEQTGVAAGANFTLTGNVATDAGDYTATATLADGYCWADGTREAKTVTWTIAAKAVTVTAKSYEKWVDDDAPAFEYDAEGLVAGEELVGTLTWDGEDTAGEHDITQAVDWENPNYAITYNKGTLTVKAYAATVDGEKCATVADALATAKDGSTVKLFADIALDEGFTLGKAVTVDLNGRTLSTGAVSLNKGLTVVDTSDPAVGKLFVSGAISIADGATLKVNASISGAGGITRNGKGRLDLLKANPFDGPFQSNGSPTQLDSDIDYGPVHVYDGGALGTKSASFSNGVKCKSCFT